MAAKPFSFVGISWQYIKHYIKAGNEHSIHSPFVFKFYNGVVKKSRKRDKSFQTVENVFKGLCKNQDILHYTDPSSQIEKKQTIGHIARKSAKPARLGRFLAHAVAYFKPAYAIEFGTSLGVSALYQNTLFKPGKFISLEANTKVLQVAEAQFEKLGLQHIKTVEGFFDEVLHDIKDVDKIEWIFFDGNHQLEPTLAYFNFFVDKVPSHCVMVFDDINWSADMQQAWRQIVAHPRVTVALDFFYLGYVFFNPDCSKQTFKLYL